MLPHEQGDWHTAVAVGLARATFLRVCGTVSCISPAPTILVLTISIFVRSFGEIEGISLGRETLRGMLRQNGLTTRCDTSIRAVTVTFSCCYNIKLFGYGVQIKKGDSLHGREAAKRYEAGSGFIQLQHKAQQNEMPGGISPSGDFLPLLSPKNVAPANRASMATTRSRPA